MFRFAGALSIAMGLALAGLSFGQATKPADTKPALPACCKAECQKMGAGCCKVDTAGKATCAMGGSCCNK
jgi:hypothetical protein